MVPITGTGVPSARRQVIPGDFPPKVTSKFWFKSSGRLAAGKHVQWEGQQGASIDIGGVTLAFSAAGDPKRPALILLHGWPFSRNIYDGVIEDLSDDAFVLTFDLPEVGVTRLPSEPWPVS